MTTPAESAWKKKTGSLFSSLRKRAGRLPFELAEFRAWLDAELGSTSGAAVIADVGWGLQ